MMTMICNGKIYDGSGTPPFSGDILIRDGMIEAVGAGMPKPEGCKMIDAAGMAVTPGFIDTHRHCDFAVLRDPNFGRLELAQGITTVLCGNCGLTPFPSTDAIRKAQYDFLEPCLGKPPAEMAFSDFPSYLSALRWVKPYVNIGAMIGTGALKIAAKGFSKTPFSSCEMEKAQAYLRQALEAGAFGISAGIMYTPECFSTEEEFIRLLQAATPYGRIFTTHIRGEGDGMLASVAEVMAISRKAQLPLNISHFKSVGCKNWDRAIYQAIALVENSGQDVTADFYPYTGGATTLLSLFPPTVLQEELSSVLRSLAGPAGRETMRRELSRPHKGWDNMVEAIGWERILISSVHQASNQGWIGKNMSEAAKEAGCGDPVEFMCRLAYEENGKVGIVVMSMAQSDVDAVARLPWSMVISDSLYGDMKMPHPRLYGAFTRVIRDLVLDRHVLRMETAIHKMTAQPAERFGITGRGRLVPGCAADINIFSPEKLYDHATFSAPSQLSSGMQRVLLGGRTAFLDEDVTKSPRGTVLVKENS